MRSRGFALLVAAAALLPLFSCATGNARVGNTLTGGDAHRGASAIFRYGCPACHTIQGIPGAHGLVGPPLTGIGDRMYVGGVLRNTPENLMRWIQDPKAVDDKTAMPKLGVTPKDAQDIAAYLYSIK